MALGVNTCYPKCQSILDATIIFLLKKGTCQALIGMKILSTIADALRKDFVILQLYWWLFSSIKHSS